MDQVLENLSGLILSNHGPHRDPEDPILSVPSCLIFPFTVSSLGRTKFLRIAEIEKGQKLSIGLEDHIPAFPAVAAVRTSFGDEAFSSKTDAAVSTVARLYMDSHLIHKLHFRCRVAKGRSGGRFAVNAHLLSFFPPGLILNNSTDPGEQSEVTAHSYVLSGVDACPLLTNQDIPGLHRLSAVNLHAQALARAVSAVPRTSPRFFVCHDDLLQTKKLENWNDGILEYWFFKPIVPSFHCSIIPWR
jgi:hypothetical protein